MKRVINKFIVIILSATFLFSGFKIVNYYYEAYKQKELFDNVENKINKKVNGKTVQNKYLKLYRENSDFVGWIKIKDTKINYPVMKTTKQFDYYLMRNFEKEYSIYGTPFIGENCTTDISAFNAVIYGHHMNNGTMFSDLIKYKDKNFYDTHKYVSFNTLNDNRKYIVVYAFVSDVNKKNSFEYYNVNIWKKKKKKYIKQLEKIKLYDTGEKISLKDKLLTLSTCDNTNKNSRMVIVCKLIQVTILSPKKLRIQGDIFVP